MALLSAIGLCAGVAPMETKEVASSICNMGALNAEVEERWYQIEGVSWLFPRQYALLADDPGLGKTRQTIIALEVARCTRILILCPAIAVPIWLQQWPLWSWRGVTFSMYRSSADKPPMTDGVVCSYDLAIKTSVRTWLMSQSWNAIIYDEMQELNGLTSQRGALAWDHLITRTERIWCLTGTPARNHTGELWRMLNRFGVYPHAYTQYADEFLIIKETLYGSKVRGTKPEARERLQRLLDQCMLRRTKGEVMTQLPAIRFEIVPVEPSPVDIRMWFEMITLRMETEQQFIQDIAEEIRTAEKLIGLLRHTDDAAGAIASLQNRTKKSRQFIGLQKVPKIMEMISGELRDGQYEKIVLFAWHRSVIEACRLALRDFNPLVLYGGLLLTKKDKVVRQFQQDPRCRVVIANIEAAGVAIDWTVATEVGFIEASYVPSDNAQAVMRVYRYPQTQPVRCRFWALYGSVDSDIVAILRRKTKDLTAVFNQAEDQAMSLDPFA